MARALRELKLTDSPQSDLHAPSVCSLDAIRAALPDGATLVEFFQVDDRIVLCLRRSRSRRDRAGLASCRASPRRCGCCSSSSRSSGSAPTTSRPSAQTLLTSTQAHLHELFKELLAPVWSQLRRPPSRHRPARRAALRAVPCALRRRAVRHRLRAPCRTRRAPASTPRCQQQTGGGGSGALVLGVADEQAPLIETEARAVAAALPDAQLFVGPDATEQVLRTRGRDSRIVHIASHGYFRPENPMFSGIRLGDTYLNVYDLYRLRMRADLVTLSGCATGANVAAAGDELLGITRGLFCAGARRCSSACGTSTTRARERFMTLLYRRIAAGAAPVTRCATRCATSAPSTRIRITGLRLS